MTEVSARTWSLRREWSRAFTIMLVLLLVSAAVSIIGVRAVVDEVEGTAARLHLESKTVAALSSAVVEHEQVAHKLLSNEPVDRAAFIQQQVKVAALFDQAAGVFPSTNGMHATVVQAHGLWQRGLATYGLWGDRVQTLKGNHSVDNPVYGASSDAVVGMLAGLEGPSLNAMDGGLAVGADLERILTAVLAGFFLLALGVTVYFRRRMTKDLMRPVATMHEGVVKLEAGDYTYRVDVARSDELGALAQAFNRMADALHHSHLALMVRATHDSLTGLANRAALTEHLIASREAGTEGHPWQQSLLFIDIDDFKDVNDSRGHECGDALLVQLATRLNGCVRAPDLVARLGGDEFAIAVVEGDSGSAAVEVAERILDAFSEPFVIGGDPLAVTVSIGVAQCRPETTDVAELLRQADFAMYMAKGGGKARYELFDAQMHDHMVYRSALKTSLGLAVASGELRLEYQPVVDLRTGQILGVEALVRWQHPTLGLLAPGEFIPLAEETGDIDDIGFWVLDRAIRQVAGWRQTMAHVEDLWVAVNLSAFQLSNPSSLAAIQTVLADPTVEADKVVLEVTETALATDVEGGIAALNMLKRFGVRIAVDDFGTGFSSLSTLAGLPVDIVKIDRSFVSGQASGAPSVPMLEGILGLARKLSLAVIAEGIEEPDQLDILRRLHCSMGQGFLLARPGPALALQTLLATSGVLPPESTLEKDGLSG